jgi:tetrapyrrole methylase family protein/MazG family protein
LDSEDCLRFASKKFIDRFNYIEDRLAEKGLDWPGTSPNDLEELWQQAKKEEKKEKKEEQDKRSDNNPKE